MKHTIVHFEIPADDVEPAKKFYGELFGWQFSSPPGFEHYWTFLTGDEDDPGGGMRVREAPEHGIVHYIQAQSVADDVDEAEKLGAKIVMPRAPVPGMGWFAQLADTEGNIFALWESDESAARHRHRWRR